MGFNGVILPFWSKMSNDQLAPLTTSIILPADKWDPVCMAVGKCRATIESISDQTGYDCFIGKGLTKCDFESSQSKFPLTHTSQN